MRYAEGDWFAVPLRDGGYGVGLLARSNPKGALLGYFFGPKRQAVPSLDDVAPLKVGDSVLIGRFGHLGLKNGVWPIVGRAGTWDRVAWPTPVFFRFEELTGRWFLMFYDDDDPLRLLREEQVPAAATQGLPQDGLMGAGFVEMSLSRILAGGVGHVTFTDAD